MNLLDRYLQAVRFFLPRQQQDDIVRELSENLISEMEDRQEALGRPLTEAEQADILRRHGHPMLVAGRYRTHRQLIGPAFFPIYIFALKIGLTAALVVTAALAAISAVLHGDPIGQAIQAMLAFPGRGLMVFAWTTLAFAAVELARAQLPWTANWDPRKLPEIVPDGHAIPRGRTLCELTLAVAAVIWLLLLPRALFLILGPAAALVDPAPVWRLAYPPIVLLASATAILHAVNFSRPYWTRGRALARIGVHSATILVLTFLLRSGESFIAAPGATLPDGAQVNRMVDIINAGFSIGFMIAVIASAVEIGRELLRLRAMGKMPPSETSPAGATR